MNQISAQKINTDFRIQQRSNTIDSTQIQQKIYKKSTHILESIPFQQNIQHQQNKENQRNFNAKNHQQQNKRINEISAHRINTNFRIKQKSNMTGSTQIQQKIFIKLTQILEST